MSWQIVALLLGVIWATIVLVLGIALITDFRRDRRESDYARDREAFDR